MRANERTDERVAQYLPLGSGLIWPTVKGFEEADEEAERPLTWVSRMGLGKALATAEAEAAEDAADKEAAMAAGATNELEAARLRALPAPLILIQKER